MPPEPGCSCLSATVCPLNAEALFPYVLRVFLVLSHLLIGGKETTGLMRDGLRQQWALKQG